MSWEQRGRRRVYYRARRVGGRVVKEYVGTGACAVLAERDDAARREEKAADLKRSAALLEALDSMRPVLAVIDEAAALMLRTAFDAAGFHQHHRGEWRRQRATATR